MSTEKKYMLSSFLVAFGMAAIILLPFVIMDGGFLVYYGDYDAQQILFYETCVKAIHSGETAWNWYTDLGVNFVGSYSFYTLGSPFFWLAALLPAEAARYTLAPLLAVKIGLSSMFAYVYIRRFVNKPLSAFIGGILYAFSGFSLYNIVFNHFHEVICFFPLLLVALEEAVVNKRKGVFAAAVALSALVNYFFFVGECVFLVIYFLCRMALSKGFRIRISDFFSLAFESITGVLISAVLMLPSLLQVMSTPKASAILEGNSFMFYENSQYYANVLKSMFFVTDIAGQNTLFPRIDHNWNSAAMYLPLFAMAGVIAFFCGTRKHWAKALLSICLVMSLIPGLNSMFTMFNQMYYARWFYMPTLICCMVTVYALENDDRFDWKFGWGINAVVVALMSLLKLFHPIDISFEQRNMDGTTTDISAVYPYFMTEIADNIYIYCGATVVLLLVLYLFIRNRNKFSREKYMKMITAGTLVCSFLLGFGCVLEGNTLNSFSNRYGEYLDAEIVIDDDSTYRIRAILPYHSVNVNMAWDMYSAQSFNSLVPSGTIDIYDYLQVAPRTEASSIPPNYPAMHALLGVKYAVVHKEDLVTADNSIVDKLASNVDGFSVSENENIEEVMEQTMIGFSFVGEYGDYYIMQNDYAIPMGFAYDNYILYDNAEDKILVTPFETISMIDRIAVEAVALTEEQVQKYADILTEIPADTIDIDSWTDERLAGSSADRCSAGVKEFSFGKNSFHAATEYESDELVVFSVPFDQGWSAFVDGEPVEIDKVNGGMIAVRVPAGKHSVDFEYTVPGLKLGIIITIAGILLLSGWTVLWYVILKKGVQCRCAEVTAHAEYIANASSIDTHGEE
ncbi:MAG: YfhO family protein [Oscillospiraceae bacterium]|nr:YfhO family protein [Oscillospiraceae bacterium]